MRTTTSLLALVALAAAAPATTYGSFPQRGGKRTVFVRAGATGHGTHRAPFGSLAQVEAVSRPRDTIVVLAGSAPLEGGIRLKPRQRLIGRGMPVLANTDSARLDGDVVRLARRTVVRGLTVTGAARGGIYGRNVRRATVAHNDVSAHNQTCTRGFHIPPFNVPTTAPGIGIPISEGLHNGWAGIMVDVTRGAARLRIHHNRVHDADCGDGIDVRAFKAAEVRARIRFNDMAELREGENLESILAIGLQASDGARLLADVAHNRQSALGNDEDTGAGPTGADSEGVFVNLVGPSVMDVDVRRNTYTHTPGRGGFSANGLEFVSMGDGGRARVDVADSTFSGTPGDVIEQLALGTNSVLRMRLDNVVATGSTGFSGSGFGDTVIIPGNNGDCVIGASGGAGNTVRMRVRDSTLTNCANNGLTFGSAVANGHGPTKRLALDVADTTITGNRGANLRLGNVSELDELAVTVQRTDLADAHGSTSSPANLVLEDLGTTATSAISFDGVCLDGGPLAALVVGYDASATNVWWGGPSAAGRVVEVGGKLTTAQPLPAAPDYC
jgi:hypothetical protein